MLAANASSTWNASAVSCQQQLLHLLAISDQFRACETCFVFSGQWVKLVLLVDIHIMPSHVLRFLVTCCETVIPSIRIREKVLPSKLAFITFRKNDSLNWRCTRLSGPIMWNIQSVGRI